MFVYTCYSFVTWAVCSPELNLPMVCVCVRACVRVCVCEHVLVAMQVCAHEFMYYNVDWSKV